MRPSRVPIVATVVGISTCFVAAVGTGYMLSPAPLPEPDPVKGRTIGPRLWYPNGSYPRLSMPEGGARPVFSLLNVPRRLNYGDYAWNDTHVPMEGETWVRIDLARQLLSIFRGGHEIGTTVILYGTDGKPTPTGTFPVLKRARAHRSSLYDAEMPFMLRLTPDGVAIHASDVKRGRATHGCIGVPPTFAARLFDAVRRGDRVSIVQDGMKTT